jgi:hypothetical protein
MRDVRGHWSLRLAAVVLVLSACGSDGDTSVTTFVSSTYHYSIDHPVEWSVVEATGEFGDGEPPVTGRPVTDILARRPNRTVRSMELPALVIGSQALPVGTTLRDWDRIVVGEVSEMKGCPQPDSREEIVIGGADGVVLRYADCPAGAGLYHLWAIAVHANRGFHLVWFNSSTEEMDDRALFDEMLASVAFT